MSLSEFLSNEMTKRGMNKAQFAREMHLHATQLSRILTSTTNRLPSQGILDNLSQNLHMSIDDLKNICYETGELPDTKSTDQPGLKEAFYDDLIDISREINAKNADQPILTAEEIAELLANNDSDTYDLHPDYAGNAKQWALIFQNYKESSKIFYTIEEIDGKSSIKIIGDCSIVFFNQKCSIPIENGVLKDSKITLDKVASMSLPGEYDLYFLNMSLIHSYNTLDYTPLVVESFLKRVKSYAERGVYFNKLYANAYSRDIGFYTALGFTAYNDSDKEDTENTVAGNIPRLYKLECFPQDFTFAGCEALLNDIQKLYDGRKFSK